MATALRESLASNCRSQRLFLVGVLIVLISPTLATAEVIFEDNFDVGPLSVLQKCVKDNAQVQTYYFSSEPQYLRT